MSFRVVAKVLDYSEERLARRLILFVLAEAAHDDGIAYLDQETIARKARLARTHVAERLVEMEDEGILEQRKAQRGRKRISVYRLSSLPGLLEPDYERLPFKLDRPFDDVGTSDAVEDLTTSDPSVDDVGSIGLTTSELARNPKVSPLTEPPIGEPPVNRPVPAKVDRKAVSAKEAELALAVLDEWNAATGQKLASKDWISKFVMRIREYPDLGRDDHAHVIATALANPWWKGAPTPSVVYGSGAQFERSLVAVVAPPPAADEPRRYGRGLTTRTMLDKIASGEIRAAVERINR